MEVVRQQNVGVIVWKKAIKNANLLLETDRERMSEIERVREGGIFLIL